MAAEIQFYHLVSTPLERALPKVMEKALDGGFRAVVRVASEEMGEAISGVMWTYSQRKFLPHGTKNDPRPERQPVFITAGNDNPNGATLLVVTHGEQVETFGDYTRLLDMFDGQDETAVVAARQRWKHYQQAGHKLAYIQQQADGSWKKQAEAN